MEVYIDDLLVKSMQEAGHLQHLSTTFSILKIFQMMLNLAKCAFGVASGKFLGHAVTKRGIEAKPEKIQEIINMWSPRSTKEVQSHVGRVAELNRLVSWATDWCQPFFKILQKAFEWSKEFEKAFQELTKYLALPLLLSMPYS